MQTHNISELQPSRRRRKRASMAAESEGHLLINISRGRTDSREQTHDLLMGELMTPPFCAAAAKIVPRETALIRNKNKLTKNN